MFTFPVALLVMASAALACNVPVFRYALERWDADLYEVVVFHRGTLDGDAAGAVKLLEDHARGAAGAPVNQRVRTVDLDTAPPVLHELYERVGSPALPAVTVRYPGDREQRLGVWTAPLGRHAVEQIAASPVRAEIARRIMDGESAVWILLESGDSARDDEAAAAIERHLDRLETTLTLPEGLEGNEAAAPVDLSTGPDLHISFSTVRLSRDDPAEAPLVAMLLHSEPDLGGYAGEPIAFPVYGRGRALYALVGDGINERNIEASCRFLTGACSCEVKALNPGVDLLIAADWAAAVTESWIEDEELPPLTGVPAVTGDDEPIDAVVREAVVRAGGNGTDAPGDAAAAVVVKDNGDVMMRNLLIALGAGLAVVIGLTLIVGVNRRGGGK